MVSKERQHFLNMDISLEICFTATENIIDTWCLAFFDIVCQPDYESNLKAAEPP